MSPPDPHDAHNSEYSEMCWKMLQVKRDWEEKYMNDRMSRNKTYSNTEDEHEIKKQGG